MHKALETLYNVKKSLRDLEEGATSGRYTHLEGIYRFRVATLELIPALMQLSSEEADLESVCLTMQEYGNTIEGVSNAHRDTIAVTPYQMEVPEYIQSYIKATQAFAEKVRAGVNRLDSLRDYVAQAERIEIKMENPY